MDGKLYRKVPPQLHDRELRAIGDWRDLQMSSEVSEVIAFLEEEQRLKVEDELIKSSGSVSAKNTPQ